MEKLLTTDKGGRRRRAAAVGMFDGVHPGHRHLLALVKEEARRRGLVPSVVTFMRHPSILLTPQCPVRLLTPAETRFGLIHADGIADVIALDFDEKLRLMSARDFLSMLHNDYGVDCLVVGFNNRFGHDRTFGFDDYRRFGLEMGMEVILATEVEGLKVSSSRIRRSLAEGDVEAAARMLGRPYSIDGRIVGGRRLGRTIGFPTANIELLHSEVLLPKGGVYAVEVRDASAADGRVYAAMLNIGSRPTVNDDRSDVTAEVHLLDFDGDLYGHELGVAFRARLRDERRFGSVEELREQLQADADAVRRILQK